MARIIGQFKYNAEFTYLNESELNCSGGAFVICSECGKLITWEDFYRDGDEDSLLCEECWREKYTKEEWEQLCEENELEDYYYTCNEYKVKLNHPLIDILCTIKEEERRGNHIDWRPANNIKDIVDEVVEEYGTELLCRTPRSFSDWTRIAKEPASTLYDWCKAYTIDDTDIYGTVLEAINGFEGTIDDFLDCIND